MTTTAARWPRARLSEIGEVVGGIQKSPDRAPRIHHRPYLTVRNVQRGWLDLSHVERFEVTAAELARLRLRSDDLLIVEGNGSLDQIGRNALFRQERDEEWIHQNHVIRVRLNADVISPAFVSAYLSSPPGMAQLIRQAQTTSGLYTLSVGKIEGLEVPVPPLAEQDRIVRNLASQQEIVERARAAAEAELAALEALPGALLRQAFSGDA